jgi:hypothetical protein
MNMKDREAKLQALHHNHTIFTAASLIHRSIEMISWHLSQEGLKHSRHILCLSFSTDFLFSFTLLSAFYVFLLLSVVRGQQIMFCVEY